MKNPACIISSALFALILDASAQTGLRIPDPQATLTKSEKKLLDKQRYHFFEAAKPAVAEAAKSTVVIHNQRKRLAFGTALTKDGAILTKWSEIAPSSNRLIITTPDGKDHAAIVTGIYKEHDLAIVKSATTLTPITLTPNTTPNLGEFVFLANPVGEVEGLGVVSVQARSLREQDKAYLGVTMDFTKTGSGILLKQVMQGSAAAKAGLQDGDVILAINQRQIQDAMEMRNLLQRFVPGSEILVSYRRGQSKRKTKVLLGSRDENTNIHGVSPARMAKMQRMGTDPNKVRDNFPMVIQSDMKIESNDTGAPVVDLNGNVIGISIARASRIKTFITPSDTILQLLTTKPTYAPLTSLDHD